MKSRARTRPGEARRRRRQPQGFNPKQLVIAGGAALLAITIITLVALKCPLFGIDCPAPSTCHFLLIDVSEGVDQRLSDSFNQFIRNVVREAKPRDKIEIARITDRSDGPTVRMHSMTVDPNWTQLQEECRGKVGNLPRCEVPQENWPRRFIGTTGKCGEQAILESCRQENELEKIIHEKIRLRPKRPPLHYSPLVEALEFADSELEHKKIDPKEGKPHKIHIYSDMLQHTRWYSMVNHRFQNYVSFREWDNYNLFLEKRKKTRELDPFQKIRSEVHIRFIRRTAHIRSDRHERKLRKFWNNLTEQEITWGDTQDAKGESQ